MLLRVLDVPRVEVDGVTLDLPPFKPHLLLIRLAVEGRWIAREPLAALFWPDAGEGDARHNLRLLLSRIRRFPWAQALECEPSRVRFAVDTDLHRFREHCARQDWPAALQWYRSPLLTHFPATAAPGFEAWIETERASVQALWRVATQACAQEATAHGRHAEAAGLLRQIWRADPLAEDDLQVYLRAAGAAGQREAGLRAYDRFSRELALSLALIPLEETQHLRRQLQNRSGDHPDSGSPSGRPLVFVGRVRELQLLRETSCAAVAGPAGSGKSALLQEALPAALYLSCVEGLQQVPLHPFLERWRGRDSWPPGTPQDDLAQLFPKPGGDVRIDGVGLLKARLLDTLVRVVQQDARQTPPTVVVDDVQWADSVTQEWLILTARRGVRVCVAYRHDPIEDQFGRFLQAFPSTTTVTLGPLTRQEVGELVRAWTAGQDLSAAVVDWLYACLGGHPLHLSEAWRLLDHRRVTGLTDLIPLPGQSGGMVQLIRRRLNGCPPDVVRVLEAASVIGNAADPDVLSAATGLARSAVETAVRRAQTEGFIRAGQWLHDLLRTAVEGTLSDDRRASLHGVLFEVLERRSVAPAVLSDHAARAGRTGDAARYAVAAGMEALRLPAWREAATQFERALGWLDAADRSGLRAEALEGEGDALTIASQYAQAQQQYLAASHLSPDDDRLGRARVLRKLAVTQWHVKAFDDALSSLKAAEHLLGTLADLDAAGWREWIDVQLERVQPLYHAGRVQEMLPIIETLRERVARCGTVLQQSRLLQVLVLVWSERDRFRVSDECVEVARERVALTRTLGDERLLAAAQFTLGMQFVFRPDFEQAHKHLDASLRRARTLEDPLLEARALTYLTVLHRRQGEVDSVRALAAQARDAAAALKMQEYVGAALGNLAWVEWRAGHLPATSDLGRAALNEWGQPVQKFWFEWLALMPLLAVSVSQARADDAQRYGQALRAPHLMRFPDVVEKALSDALLGPSPLDHAWPVVLELAHSLRFT